MKIKAILTTLASVAVITGSVSRAAADASDVLGGVVGGIIGGVIVNEGNRVRQQQQRPRTVVRRAAPGISAAQRAANRETQQALNYFGFPAGTPDGVLGRNSRNAISQFQGHLGYPVTGQLTGFERDFLISSFYRAQAGGVATSQLVAQQPNGVRGLLTVYRNEAAGIVATPQTPNNATVTVVTPTVPVQEAKEPAPVETAAPVPAIPNFGAVTEVRSMASHCNSISLLTSSNGGLTKVSEVTDPAFALSEQFCLARTFAIANGEALARQIEGVTQAQMDEQCTAFAPLMQSHVAALSLSPQDKVLAQVREFTRTTGQAPAQLASTATICLSSGYRTDNADVAISSALLLVAVGEPVYSEILGHHLSQGFGATQRNDLALPWYEVAISALEGGAPGVFAPGQADRGQLLRVAVGLDSASAGAQVVPVFNLPTKN